MTDKGWLMELAEAERKLIHLKGSNHPETKAAREDFKMAWEQVRLIQISYNSPCYLKEAN